MKILKSFSIYTFVGFFGAGINFLVMPFLTHYLSPIDYGTLSLLNSYVTVLIPVIGLTASSLISVEYFKMRDNNDFASLFSSILLVPILPFLFFLLISLFFHEDLAKSLEFPTEDSDLIFLIPLLAFLTIQVDTFINFLVITKNSYKYGLLNVSKVVLELSLTVIFIVYFKMNWKGRLLSWLIVSALNVILFSFFLKRERLFSKNINWNYFKAGIVYGAPLVLHTIGKYVVNQSDRLFIAKMINVEEVGLYNVGYQIGSVLLIIITSFYNVFVPFLYERLSSLNVKAKFEIVRMSYGFLIILFFILLILTFTAPILFKYLINTRFKDGLNYVFWVGLGYFFWGGYMIFAGYIYYLKKNKILAYMAIVNVITNLIFNYLFILWFGAIGAAYATCLSFFIICVIIANVSNNLFKMPWFEFRKIITLAKRDEEDG